MSLEGHWGDPGGLAQIEESVARNLSQLDTADRQEPSEALAIKTNRLKEKLAKLEEEMENEANSIVKQPKDQRSVEDEYWYALKEIARDRNSTLGALISSIDELREFPNLSSAIRLFVLRFYQEKALISKEAPLTLADLSDGKF